MVTNIDKFSRTGKISFGINSFASPALRSKGRRLSCYGHRVSVTERVGETVSFQTPSPEMKPCPPGELTETCFDYPFAADVTGLFLHGRQKKIRFFKMVTHEKILSSRENFFLHVWPV
jgi:hypothetical protein